MYVVLRKTEKCVPCGGSSWYHGMFDVISEVDVLMYVVLSKTEIRVPYGGSSWYHGMFDVISEEDVLMYVVLSKTEKCMPYGGSSWFHRMTLYPRYRTKWCRYDRVQLYIICTIFYFSR